MPTFDSTPRGTVVSIWGKAYIRGADGVWRPLKLGELVKPGDEVLTEQNTIVLMTRPEAPLARMAAPIAIETDRAISNLDSGKPEDAPAAGLAGGDGGDLQPGLRVDRIVEPITPATLATQLDRVPVVFGLATRSDPGESADASRVSAASSNIAAVEQGGAVNLGLRTPTGAGTLTITVTQVPTIGQVVRADGTPVAAGSTLSPADIAGLRYLPPADYDGTAVIGTFGYSVTNGTTSANGSTQISVTPVNDAPVATAGSASAQEDGSVGLALRGSDTDGTVTSVTVTALPAGGTLLLADGVTPVLVNQALTPAQAAGLVFRPNADFNGNANLSFTVTDNGGLVSSPATFAIDVTPVNDPPLAFNDSVSTVAQTPVTLAVLANDRDVDGDVLSVTGASVNAAQGTVTLNADGSIGFTAAPGVSGPVVITYTIADPSGASATATLTVNVAALPTVTVDAPALTNDTTPTIVGTSNVPPGSTVTLTVTASNGAVQTITTTVRADGTYSVDVPAPLADGPYSVTASVTVAGVGSANANDGGSIDATAPTITVDAPALGNDNTPTLVGTTDLPAGSTITLTITGANGAVQSVSAIVQAGGTYSVDVPSPLVDGPYSVVAVGTDTAGNSASASDTGVVDTAPPVPTIALDGAITPDDVINAAEAGASIAITGTVGGDAKPGDTVTLTVNGNTYTGTVSGARTFSIAVPGAVLAADADRVIDASITTTDAAGNSASASDIEGYAVDTTPPAATITIDPVTADNIVNAGEATGTITLTGTVGGDAKPGDSVTLTVNGVAYTGTVLAGNTFAIPVAGSDVLADAGRTIDGAVTTVDAAGNSSTATTTRLYAVNTAPVAVADANSVGEDAANASGDVTPSALGQDSDADGDALTVIGAAIGNTGSAAGNVGSALAGAWGTLVLNGDGSYTYTPAAAAQALDAGETVTDTFTYTIADGRGGSASATLTISVVGADDPTLITGPLTGTVQEDAVATATGTLVASDADVGTRAFFAQSASGSYGSFSIGITGAWTYTLANAAANVQALAAGETHTETFVVSADDGTTASISVTVNGSNDAPVVSSTSINAVEQGAAVALGLALPTDIDNGAVLTITVTGLPAIGQVQLADGTPVVNGTTLTAAQLTGLQYLPPADYDGTAAIGSFGYSVGDGIATVAGGTTIAVATVNDPPVAYGASAGTGENAVLNASVPAGTDVDGTVASYALATGVGSGNGTLTFNTDGSYTFNPGSDFDALAAGVTRTVSFTYTAIDNNGAPSAPATITITVTGTNDAPVAVADALSIGEDAALASSTVLPGTPAQDRDVDGGTITVTGVAVGAAAPAAANLGNGIAGTWGTLTLNGDGSYSYVPSSAAQSLDAGETVADVFTYQIGDGQGGSATATLTISVVGADDPTTISGPVTGTVQEDAVASASGTLAASDPDVGTRAFVAQSNSAGTYGTFSITSTGTWTYTLANAAANVQALANGETHNETFVVAADDNTTTSITVTVNGRNDAPVVSSTSISAVEEGAAVPLGLAVPTDLDNGAVLTISVTGLPSIGQVQLADGTPVSNGATLTAAQLVGLRYLPPAEYDGTSAVGSFAYTVNDGIATVPGGTTIALAAFNDPPLAVVTPASGDEDTPVAVSLTGTDVDGTIVSVTVTTLPANGTLYLADGTTPVAANTPLTPAQAASLIFMPAPDFNGTVSLVFTVTDNGGAVSAPATLPIAVGSVVDPTVSIGDVSVNESAGTITFTVTLSAPTTATVTVDYASADGSALDGSDYSAGSGTLTFAPGQTTRTVTLTIADDGTYEGSENLTVALTNAVNGTIADGSGLGTIDDSADIPVLAVGNASTAEGGYAVFTVSLGNPSTTAVTFNPTLASGTAAVGTDTASALEYFNGSTWVAVTAAGVTIAAGSTSVDVRVATTDDVLAEGSEAFTLTATVSAGTTSAPSASGTGTIADDLDATTLTLSAAPSVAEGGSIVYTASVSNVVTGSPLVITLTNGQTITIPVGQSSATSAAFAVRADDAYAQGTQTLTVGISSTSGGGYEALTTTSTASTTVTDDGDATTVAVSTTTTTVSEGGSIVYTVTTGSAVTGSALVVMLSNGQTVTIPVGASSASSAPFAVRGDDAYLQGTQALAVTITGTSGGNFEAVTPTGTASTTVTDDTDATTVTITASAASVAEGGSITYTASVNNAVTGSPLVVTLTNGQTITIPVGQSSATGAAFSVRADDAYAQGDDTLSVGIDSTSGGNYEALTTTSTASTTVTDDGDASTVTVSTTTATVSEGGSIVYTVATSSAVTGSALVVTLSNGQTVTIPVGQSSASSAPFTVRADDAYVQGTQTLAVTITGTTGGSFEAVTPAGTASTAVTDDADATTVTITASTASVAEGGSITYTASVNNAVTGSPLAITLSNGQTITIPVGQSSATGAAFSVRADDAYAQGNETLSVGIGSTSGGNYEALTTTSTATTTVTDDGDTTTVTVSTTTATVSEGGSIVYTVTTSNAVAGSALVVTLSNGQTVTIPVGQSSASSAPFAVRADDVYVQGSQTLAVTITGTTGGSFEAVTPTGTATTSVTDDADATTVTITASAATVGEGGSITYTASVNNAVTDSPLAITLSNGQTITIPVGQSSASSAAFAVRADDAYVQGTQTLNVGITATSGGNYEALTTTSTASTTVTDDSDATLVTITASAATVAEGGSIIYTASVNNAVTGSPLAITLSNGQTITIPVGASSASSTPFAVRADDVYVQGTQTLNVGIATTSGGDYEALTTTSTAGTTVTDDTDDTDATTVTITASAATVTEGGSIVYTAATNSPVTGSDLVVSLSNGQTITIPVGQSSASSAAFAVRPDDGEVQGTQTLAVTITGTTGGNFEAVTPTGTATTNVTDDADATTVTVSTTTATVSEGGSIVYTVTTGNPVTGAALVVTLSNGQTITIPVGQSSASSAPFAVRADDAYAQGTQTLAVTIAGTTGGSFEAVTPTGTATTSVTDDADATTVTITASAASVAEGGSITYTASVNNPVTGSPLVITLTNGQTVTIPVGQSSATGAAFAVRADDAYVQGAQTLSVGIGSTSGGNYEALTTTSTALTTVTDDGDATTVSISTATATVSEGGSIVYTATTGNPVTGSTLVVSLSNGQTITIPVGQSSASSTPFAVRADDVEVQGTQTLNITITGTSGGNFEAVTPTGTATTTVTDDADATTVTITASTASVAEGGSITYTASVNNAVTGSALVVTLSNGQTITIPAGQSSASGAPFAVRADDAYLQGTQTLNVGISSTSGGNYEALTTTSTVSSTVTDDADATLVTITASTASVAEGGSIVYTVTTSSPVTGSDLVVSLSNGQTVTIPVGSSSASSAAFAVRADDVYLQGTQTLAVTIAGTSGGNFEAVTTSGTATTAVTDDTDATTLSITGPASVSEGADGTYTVSLTSAAQSAVTITLAYGGTAANGSDYTGVATVTIAAGASSATFDIAALDDTLAEGSESFTVTAASVSGGNFENLVVSGSAGAVATTLLDNDAANLDLSATPSITEAGGTIVYTATLSEPAVSALTVTLSNGAVINIAAGALTGSVSVPVAASDDVYVDAGVISATIVSTSGGGIALNVGAAPAVTAVVDTIDTTTVTLTASAATVGEGGSIVYTASVNNAVTGSPLVVTLSNGQTVTIPVGQSSATSAAFAVRADDAYVQGTQTLNVAISGTSGGNYEALATSSTVSTTVTDDSDATTVTVSTATATVTEGGSIVYVVTTNNPVSGSALVVTLSNGQTVTIPVGQSSASSAPFAVRADDVDVQGTQTLNVTITGTTGGNFEAVTPTGTATTTVTDDADATTVTITASAASVTEGGSITYTVSVNNAVTGSPLVITLTNGQTITIPVGQSSATGTAFAVRADDAYAQGDETLSVGIGSTSGGNYEALTTTSTASTTVTDDGDATTVAVSTTTTTVSEGGSIVYTVTTGSAVTGSALVVMLSNGQTVTIPVGQSSASSAPFAVRADDAYVQGTQTLAVTITGTTGGSFESVTPAGTASTTVTDDADATTVTITASAASVVEGGSITYTASVNNAVTGSPLVITLTNGQTITIPVGQSSASSAAFSVRADDAYAQGTQTLSVGIDSTSGGSYEALATSSTATTTVTDDADATTVTVSTATATVTEGGSIVYTVTTSAAVSGSALAVTLSNGQTVTIPVGASSASSAPFAVRADDAYVQGTQTLAVTITGTTGGSFEAVSPAGTATTTVTDDADATAVTLTASAATVTEGGSITYTASVNNAVTGSPLAITLSNGQTITIPVGQSSASSTAFAVRGDDAYAQGTQTLTVGISSTSGGTYEALTTTSTASTTVTDDGDATTVTVSTATATVTEGGSIVYTVTTSNAVTGSALVVTLSNGQTVTIPVGASSASSAPFAVRADDAYLQGTQTLAVTIIGTTGGTFEALTPTGTASTTVTDDADATTVTITASAASVVEGGSITYTASVNNAVSGSPLVVTLSNGQTITIPVGQSSGTSAAFAVRADDVYAQGTQTLNVGTSGTSGGNYEALTTTSTASTNVTDDGDATTVTVSTATATVTEGGSVVYTVTTSSAVAGSALVVTLSNGQTITIPVGQSSASSAPFAVRADDAYAQGTQTLAVTIAGTTGGSFEAVTPTGTATTSVTDDADATTVTITASAATVTEGGSITYTASVNNAVAGSPLVINLSNGQTIMIPVGQSSGTSAAFAVRADDAYAQGTQTLNVGISGTSGGNYEALTTTSTASTNVTDDGDATTVTVSTATATVTEGGSVVYTVTTSSAVAGSALVVTLSNGQTVTIPVGASSASSAPFAVRADDAYAQGTQTVAVTITGTTGANFEAVSTSGTASTTVSDDADATTVTITASTASVAEGGSITYTASVNNAVAGAPLVINLSNGQTITIPVGQSSASSAPFAVRADDAYVQGTQTLNVGISGTSGGNYEALTTTSTASTTVTDDSDATTVTVSTTTATVSEGGSIVYTVTASNTVAGSALVVTLSNGQTVTIPVGASSASSAPFTVRADDAYVQGTQTLAVTITGTTGANFEAVARTGTASTTVTDDADATTVTITASAVTITEGGSITYTASVNNAVTGTPLVINLSNGQTITIPVGTSSASSAAFAVRADDAYLQGPQTLTVGIGSTSGGNYEALTTTSTAATTVTDDNHSTTVTVSTTTATVTEGGSIVYTVTTNNAVSGSALVVSLSNGQSVTIPVGASSASSAPFAVRADDAYVQGSQTLAVTITGTTGGNFEAVTRTGTASTTVTDDSDATTVTITASTASVGEGGSIVYTASVNNAVTGSALAINLSNGQTITIPVGSSSASSAAFAVRADDAYLQGTQTLTVGISSTSGGSYEALTTTSTAATTVTDDADATTVTLTASAASVVEGGSITYTASVNNAVTGSPLVINLSNGQTITIPVGQSSATSTAFAVRADDLYAQGTQTLTVGVSSTSGGNYEALTTTGTASTTVTDDADTTTASITASTASLVEGGSITYTVTLTSPALTAVTVNLAYSGTASNGSDYASVASVTIAAGTSSASFTIATTDDAVTESSESITVAIASMTGGGFENLAIGSSATTTITDNDTPPLGRDATVTTTEDNGFTFSLANFLMNDAEQGTNVNPSAVRIDVLPTPGTLTLSGTAVTAGQVILAAQIANLVFTPAANANGTGYANFTFSVRDASGQFDTAPNTITVNVTAVNDAPTIGSAAATGTEDTARVLAWADFAVNDVDNAASSLSVTITSLPADGALQFDSTGLGNWIAVTANQSVTQANIAAGRLRFVPDADESGVDAYGSGTGNVRGDYAQFGFTATDGTATSAAGTMRIDLNPVADATTLSAAANTLPTSTGLTRTVHSNVGGLDATLAQTLNNIEVAVEGDGIASTSTITAVSAAITTPSMGSDDAMRISGFVYLQAGSAYTFSGTFEDTLTLEIGGRRLFGAAYDGSNSDDESITGGAAFTPLVSGYYSVELISYNVGGDAGFIDLYVSTNGGTAVAFNTTNFNLQPNTAALNALPNTVGPLVAATDTNTGGVAALSVAGYYAQHGGSVVRGQPALLRSLSATFGDSSDNSERHTITLDLTAAPVGTRVFVDANGDGAPDDGRVFTTSAGNTSVVVYDEDGPASVVGGSNWDLSAIVVDAPTTFTGSFNISAVSRADEMAGASVLNFTTSTQTLTVTTVAANNLAPDVGNVSASVSEEGLAGGLADASGTPDTTNATSVSGTISISDAADLTADSITAVTLTAPSTALTSGGVAVTWSGAGTGTLTASAGSTTVATLTINTSGNYTFTLLAPIDQSAGGGENALTLGFGVQASDGINTGSGSLTMTIEDDQPNPLVPISHFIAGTDTNLLIVLDLSGSMTGTDGVNGSTRLESAVASITTLLDRYDEFGAVRVRLVTFSDGAAAQGTTWTDIATAKATLTTLTATGATNYDAGLGTAITAFADAGKLSTGQNISYFFSDGAPTRGSGDASTLNGTVNSTAGDVGIQSAEETTWNNFLTTNAIRSFSIGLGSGVSTANLNPIAYDGQSVSDSNSVVVASFDDLDNSLASTIQGAPAGGLAAGGTITSGGQIGADGGYVASIGIEGSTYAYNPASGGSITVTGTNNSTFDTATNTLTVSTSMGGQFAIDMDDGTYRYSAPDAVPASFVENVAYTLSDDDGDTQASTITVTVDRTNTIIGSTASETLNGTAAPDYIVGRDGDDILNGNANNDVMLGGAGNDTLNGGTGNDRLAGGVGADSLTGGAGADTFEWRLSDRGAAGSPPNDTVADFDIAPVSSGGDILDLRDLLQNETSSTTLDRYLDFTVDGSNNTVIRISSTGGFTGGTYASAAEDQRITLTNGGNLGSALLGNAGASDAQIIAELINRGKLVTDVTT